MIHGAGIYANIGGILMGSMLPYIAAPWILYGCWLMGWFVNGIVLPTVRFFCISSASHWAGLTAYEHMGT